MGPGGGAFFGASSPVPLDRSASFKKKKRKGKKIGKGVEAEVEAQRLVVLEHEGLLSVNKEIVEQGKGLAQMQLRSEIERIKGSLPLAFLQKWGMGEYSLDRAMGIIKEAFKMILKPKTREAMKRWKRYTLILRRADEKKRGDIQKRREGTKLFCKLLVLFANRIVQGRFGLWKRRVRTLVRKEKRKREFRAARLIQRTYRKHRAYIAKMNRLRERNARRQADAVAISVALQMEVAHTMAFRLHLRNKRRAALESRAQRYLHRAWRRHALHVILQERFKIRKAILAEQRRIRRERAATSIGKGWRASVWRGLVHKRVVDRREREEARRQKRLEEAREAERQRQMNIAASRVQLAYRKYKGDLEMHLRFAKRRAEMEAAKQLEREIASAKAIQKTYRSIRLWKAVGYRIRLKKEAARRERARIRRLRACEKIQKFARYVAMMEVFRIRFYWMKTKILCKRQREKERCAVRTIIQAYKRYKGRYEAYLEELARLAREEEERKRREEEERLRIKFERETAAATVIQRAWTRYLPRRVIKYRVHARKELIAAQRYQAKLNRAAATIQRYYAAHQKYEYMKRRAREERVALDALRKFRKESAAAQRIQRQWRHRKGMAVLEERFEERLEQIMLEREIAFLSGHARTIQRNFRAYRLRYYNPVRIAARNELARKRKKAEEERIFRLETRSATVIAAAFRHYVDRKRLNRRFKKRREILDAEELHRRRTAAAKVIQGWFRRWCMRQMMNARFMKRAKMLEDQRQLERETAAAKVLQKAWRSHWMRRVLEMRFAMRRRALDAQAQMEANIQLTEEERIKAEEEKAAMEEHLGDQIRKAWKLGSDAYGVNYFYNWITEETTYTQPEGWSPAEDEIWVRNVDDRGNVYYFNQLTGQSKWSDENVKEELGEGEVHCVNCQTLKATRMCNVCRDAYCDDCFDTIHRSGWLAQHRWTPYMDAKKGWNIVRARTANEKNYYVKAGEEGTYDKPAELMLEDDLYHERQYHEKALEYQAAAARYAKKIEKLQVAVETLQYEKDSKWYEDSLAQSKLQEEMDIMKAALDEAEKKKSAMSTFREILRNPKRHLKAALTNNTVKDPTYRRKLLLSKSQKRGIGMAT